MPDVREILNQWGALAHGETICNPQTSALNLQKFNFEEARQWFNITGSFADDCALWLDPKFFPPGIKGSITALNPERPRQNIKIAAVIPTPALQMFICEDDVRVFTGAVPRLNMHAMLWGGSTLVVGDATTCNGARVVMQRSGLVIGRDAMLSDEILLQGSQQHTLVDLTTMSALNREDQTIVIGEHVWLGRRTTIMPGVRIGKGSVLAAGAVATRDVPECSVAAGVPAVVIRENVSWCRNSTNEVDAAELAAAGLTSPA